MDLHAGRGPSARDVEPFGEACERIREGFANLVVFLSLGLMERDHADTVKGAGAGWVHHNLNASRRFYPKICTTHTWDDRVRTIENVRAAGLSTCSGGIIGMGESEEDLLDLAYATRRLKIDSVPVNFLNSIKGPPLEGRPRRPGCCRQPPSAGAEKDHSDQAGDAEPEPERPPQQGGAL